MNSTASGIHYGKAVARLCLPIELIPALNVRKFTRETWIAFTALAGIALHLALRYVVDAPATFYLAPLWFALLLGGAPLVFTLGRKVLRGEFGSDLLAGISIVAAVTLREYLVGVIVVLMLSGGTALENYATQLLKRSQFGS